MSSAKVCALPLRLLGAVVGRGRLSSGVIIMAASVLLILAAPAWAILTGPPIATSGQIRFEVVPLGPDKGAATFSSTLSAPFTPGDGKLYYELDSAGNFGFSGYPALGAPAIAGGVGPSPLPLAAALPATGAFGGGAMAIGTGLNALTFGPPAVADPGPNGFASVSVGFGQATWTNRSFVSGGTDTLPVVLPFAEMVTVPVGALYEVGFAGRILYPGGPTFGIVAGIDNTGTGSRRAPFMNGGVGGDPNNPIVGIAGGFTDYSFKVIETAPTTFLITGFGVFTTPVADGAAVQLNGTLTAAMDPGNGTYVRPAPYPTGIPVIGAEGITISAAEAPSFSSEWTNTAGTHDFNTAANFSDGAPPATGEAFLADGPTTPDGKMISAVGTHSLHLLTVANSTSPNYTIGLAQHEGTFTFGGNGGIEVYSGGATVINSDVKSAAQLNFRVADPSTVLHQFGDVTAPFITVDGLGTLQFYSPNVTFDSLTANLGTTEFMVPVNTTGNYTIGSGATVKFDGANSTLNGPGSVTINTGGALWFVNGGNNVAAGVTNSGTIHLSGAAPTLFTGSLTNNGNILLDAGASAFIAMPYSAFGSGTITNNGMLNFNSTFSGSHGITGTGLTVFNGQVSTGTGAGSTANLNVSGNAVINSELFMRLTGTGAAPSMMHSRSAAI